MPRRSRIQIVGKLAAWQVEMLAAEMAELGRELRAEWQQHGEDATGVRPTPGEVSK